MRVLGIDPGSRVTGFGVVDIGRTGLVYVASGCVRAGEGEVMERLGVIYHGVIEVVQRYAPEVAAIERVFMARNPDSAIKLGQARGAAACALIQYGLPIVEYTALQIKQSIVGRGHAAKEQVQHMVRALLSLDGIPQSDAADALACAVCHAHRVRNS